ncbi:MAG: protein TolA, partial [Methylobacter sp.]|nr:protein TolA [Candidatus Methylobacter titanis]
MDSKRKFTWPVILALALHLTILGLFALSALIKPEKIESEAAPEIIHAEIVDEATVKNPAEAIAEPAKEENSQVEEAIKQETEVNQEAEPAAQAKAEAKQAEAAQAKAEAATQARAEAK